MKDIINLIDSYENFPKKGIIFKDILGILKDPPMYKKLIHKMSKNKIIDDCDAILAIDARGFIFGSAISFYSSKPMIVTRKKGKLPGDLLELDYDLEYGKNTLCIQKDSFRGYEKIAIVDDLIASGGTAKCVCDMLYDLKKSITGMSVVVELSKFDARSKLKIDIDSQIIFD